MKKVIALAVTSLALVAGSAHAGGCSYGKQQVTMAAAEEAVDESIVVEQDPRLLAQLQAQDAAAELETVVVPN